MQAVRWLQIVESNGSRLEVDPFPARPVSHGRLTAGPRPVVMVPLDEVAPLLLSDRACR
jgi:hypothetical protein